MKEFISRKDIHGVTLQEGDIVAEGIVGEKIWDGKAILIKRPIGYVTVYHPQRHTGAICPEETDCYNITPLLPGRVSLTDIADPWMKKRLDSSIHLSRYDGRFYAWDNIEIIGSLYDLDKPSSK